MAGLKNKYNVYKLNDSTAKHAKCRYFVLDPKHDRHAVKALKAYANSVRIQDPELAESLDRWVQNPEFPPKS